VVLKFGGESLQAPRRVTALVRETRRGPTPVVVVVSARRGVTDLLRHAAEGTGPAPSALRTELRRLNPGLPPEAGPILDRAEHLAASARTRRRRDPALEDDLLSAGERLSAHWLARQLRDGGVPATSVEADRAGLRTDNTFGAARIRLRASARSVRRTLGPLLHDGRVPVVTGYIGRSQDGRTATLGRGGSDYTATALGYLLRASRVELVKRHAAILTADPRLVPSARPIHHLSYAEAEEFAQFGAQVLHPVTIAPARLGRIEIHVRSLQDPGLVTSIGPGRAGSHVRAVTLRRPLRAIRWPIAGGRQRPGIIDLLSSRLTQAGVNLSGIYTTEGEIGLLLEPVDVEPALRWLAPLGRSLGAAAGGAVAVALVSAVGENLLAELANVRAPSPGGVLGLLATPRSISVVVPDGRAVVTLRAFHRAFVEHAGRRSASLRSRSDRPRKRGGR
jgi:aspartate kinase